MHAQEKGEIDERAAARDRRESRRRYSCMATRTVLRASAREMFLTGVWAVVLVSLRRVDWRCHRAASLYDSSAKTNSLRCHFRPASQVDIGLLKRSPGARARPVELSVVGGETNRVRTTVFDHVFGPCGARNDHHVGRPASTQASTNCARRTAGLAAIVVQRREAAAGFPRNSDSGNAASCGGCLRRRARPGSAASLRETPGRAG